MPRYCANLKAVRYESTSLNRIVADKSDRVIVPFKLQLHDAIYRLQFYSNSLIHILSLPNSHNNAASIQKNWDNKSHRVIVALVYKTNVFHVIDEWLNKISLVLEISKRSLAEIFPAFSMSDHDRLTL